MRPPRLNRVRVTILVLAFPFAVAAVATVVSLVLEWSERPSVAAFRRTVAGADTIVVDVQPPAMMTNDGVGSQFSVTDPTAVEAVVGGLDIVPPPWGENIRCMCEGDVHLAFHRDGVVLAEISLHHARRLRWRDRWESDVELTPESQVWVRQWLRSHGVHVSGGQ